MGLTLRLLPAALTVCRISDPSLADWRADYTFLGKTDDEISLVCPTDRVPNETLKREDGWCAFKIEGILDFSLVGILARISTTLAEAEIGIFALSTYNTDYVLVKKENAARAVAALQRAGYEVRE